MNIGNKSGFLAGIMRRYSKDLALAADANNSGNLCMFNMQIDCVLRIICTFVVFVILYVSREHSNGRINTAYFSRKFTMYINLNTS
jgi:hypothetical protein